MTSAAWSASDVVGAGSVSRATASPSFSASLTVRFLPASVRPGRLMLIGTPGCTTCCKVKSGTAVDVRLCAGVEPADLRGCLSASAATLNPDGMSLSLSFAGPPPAATFNTVVAMATPELQCVIASNATIPISVATSAVLVDPEEARLLGTAASAGGAGLRPFANAITSGSAGLFATPPLGWNAWNAFHCALSERLLIAMADAMVESGLAASGFQYVNLDDCWMVDREPDGTITADPVRFPSGIKALVDYIHSKGLRFGVYQAPGPKTPQGRPGLSGHEAQDVATFCSWGVLFDLGFPLNHHREVFGPTLPRARRMPWSPCPSSCPCASHANWCLQHDVVPDSRRKVDYIKLDSRGSTRAGWEAVRAAIAECDRPIFLQVAFCEHVADCEGWMDKLANSWRTGPDSQANWASVMTNVDGTEPLYALAGPTGPIGGHYNDADLLEVGNVGLSDCEVRSQIALWAFMNVPLLLSADLRHLMSAEQNATLGLIKSPGMLALNQDPLGYPGRRISGGPNRRAGPRARGDPETNDAEVWVKRLGDGDVGLLLLNRGESPILTISVQLASVPGLTNVTMATVVDVWTGANAGTARGSLAREVPSHGVVVLRLTPVP